MRKASYFFKSLIPFLVAIVMQFAITIPLEIIYAIKHTEDGNFLEALFSATSDTDFLQTSNFCYGVLAVIVCTIWYQKVFVRPFARKPKNYPTGFSFHTICALIFLAVGLQYVANFVATSVGTLHPAWLTSYRELMQASGFSEVTLLLAIYTVFLAPISEELIFRGLIFRYARHALPFWLANIWQALLFGVLHMNIIQGVYAFVIGIFLGCVCHRGRGIKYSIVLHILFNIIGTFYSGLISFSTTLSYEIFTGVGIALTVFGVWLFYSDFIPARQKCDPASE